MTIPIIQKDCKTLSVTCGDSSPKGRAKGLAPLYIVCWHEKWSVSVLIRSIDCFMNTHLRLLRFFVPRKNPCGEAALHGAKLYFIFHAPKGALNLKKALQMKCFFHGAPSRIWFSASVLFASCAPRGVAHPCASNRGG